MSGAGYTRQSAANITSGQPFASAPVNNEFNQLVAAFSGASGHAHDGSSGNGPVLTSAAIGISTTTPGIVAATGAAGVFAAVTMTSGNGITITNATGASGNPTFAIATSYIGQASITTLGTITTGMWNGSTVPVAYGGTGTTTSTGTGSVVLSNAPTFTGTVAGNGISFTSAGFGSLNVTGAVTLTNALPVAQGGTGATTAAGAQAGLGLGTMSTQNASAVTITGGSLDGVTIGANTPAPAITASQFTGPLNGTASNASNIITTNGATNTNYYPLFGPNPSGTQAVSTSSALTFNPSSGNLTTTTFSGQLNGTISSGTTATTQAAGDSSTKIATTAFVNGSAIIRTVKGQIFTNSGTYTPSTGMLYCIVEVIGGGGSGASSNVCGGGGGAGGYSRSILSAATVGANQAVTVGAGGAGSVNTVGNSGGDSKFGSLLLAKGGLGGATAQGAGIASGTFYVSVAAGGIGGNSAQGTGQFVISGNPGQVGIAIQGGNTVGWGGGGGMSFYGSGAIAAPAVAANSYTNAGQGFGSGGAGSSGPASTVTSGGGTAGVVIITEYCSQ